MDEVVDDGVDDGVDDVVDDVVVVVVVMVDGTTLEDGIMVVVVWGGLGYSIVVVSDSELNSESGRPGAGVSVSFKNKPYAEKM